MKVLPPRWRPQVRLEDRFLASVPPASLVGCLLKQQLQPYDGDPLSPVLLERQAHHHHH